MKILTAILLCFAIATGALAQGVVTVQPKIMVLPYAKQGEDLRTVLEDDVNRRIVLTKIKEAFDNRGFTTVDFEAKIKAVSQNAAFQDENQTDLRTLVVEQSGADIAVEAEISVLLGASGNSVKVILKASETSTGNSLANKVGESGKFYTEDIGKLGAKAIESCATEFLNTMQMKFNDIVEHGRSIMINFGVNAESAVLFSSEIGTQGLALSDEIELWMEKAAYKNNYHIQGTTDRAMIFDDVRIPLKDPATGNNYNINKFSLELFKFMRKLGLQVQRQIKGNTLYINIQ